MQGLAAGWNLTNGELVAFPHSNLNWDVNKKERHLTVFVWKETPYNPYASSTIVHIPPNMFYNFLIMHLSNRVKCQNYP